MIKFEFGSIYMEDNSRIIENPAVMYDAELGVLIAWGNEKSVRVKYERWTGSPQVNKDPLFPNIIFLTFNKMNMTNEQIFKILWDMIHINGYCKTFHDEFLVEM